MSRYNRKYTSESDDYSGPMQNKYDSAYESISEFPSEHEYKSSYKPKRGSDYRPIRCEAEHGPHRCEPDCRLPRYKADCGPSRCETRCETKCETRCEPICKPLRCEPICEPECKPRLYEPECEPECRPRCEPECRPRCEPECRPRCEPECRPRCEPRCIPPREPIVITDECILEYLLIKYRLDKNRLISLLVRKAENEIRCSILNAFFCEFGRTSCKDVCEQYEIFKRWNYDSVCVSRSEFEDYYDTYIKGLKY